MHYEIPRFINYKFQKTFINVYIILLFYKKFEILFIRKLKSDKYLHTLILYLLYPFYK